MILCNLGVFQMMILRFNLSMAIVCMTDSNQKNITLHEPKSTQDDFSSNSSNISQVLVLKKRHNTKLYSKKIGLYEFYLYHTISFQEQAGEFDWSKEVRGVILSAFFYGYICTQLIGGIISDKWGGKLGMLFGIGVLSLGSILSPVMAR